MESEEKEISKQEENQLMIDFFSCNDEEVEEHETLWRVRVINVSNNVFEKRVKVRANENNGEPDREEIATDFFINRHLYKHTGTLEDINRAALKRMAKINEGSLFQGEYAPPPTS